MKALAVYLERNQLTQARFASNVGLSQPTIANLVNGVHSASSEVLKTLSRETAYPVDVLLMTDAEFDAWDRRGTPPRRAVAASR